MAAAFPGDTNVKLAYLSFAKKAGKGQVIQWKIYEEIIGEMVKKADSKGLERQIKGLEELFSSNPPLFEEAGALLPRLCLAAEPLVGGDLVGRLLEKCNFHKTISEVEFAGFAARHRHLGLISDDEFFRIEAISFRALENSSCKLTSRR